MFIEDPHPCPSPIGRGVWGEGYEIQIGFSTNLDIIGTKLLLQGGGMLFLSKHIACPIEMLPVLVVYKDVLSQSRARGG